jgi:hypothetical protein
MAKGLTLPDDFFNATQTHGIVDDFYSEDTAIWTTTATDTGTSTVGDAAGGVMALTPSDGTVADNDEIYLQSKEVFRFAAGKPIKFAARVQFTEANADDANVFVGLMDAPIANALLDDGAGPKASFSGVGFYKVDGGTRWQVIYSIATTRVVADLSATNTNNKIAATAGGASYQLLEIDVIPITSTTCNVEFAIDGSTVYTMKDRVWTNGTEMAIAFGLKNGAATNVETLNIDYVACAQKR